MSGHAINSWCGVAFDECFEDPPCDVCAMRAENQRCGLILTRLVAWSESVPRDETEMLHVIVADAREALAGDAE